MFVKPKNQLTVSAEEFAKWILKNLEFGDGVTFALNRVSDEEVENWWYVKLINIPEYDAAVCIIDYCGGGFATSFSLCEDDEWFIASVVHYFENCNDWYNNDEKIIIDLNDIKRGGTHNA